MGELFIINQRIQPIGYSSSSMHSIHSIVIKIIFKKTTIWFYKSYSKIHRDELFDSEEFLVGNGVI